MSLCPQNRIPFVVPDRVPWSQMSEALSCKFMSEVQTTLALDRGNLHCLAQKIFDKPDISEDFSNTPVSWAQFNKVLFLLLLKWQTQIFTHHSVQNNHWYILPLLWLAFIWTLDSALTYFVFPLYSISISADLILISIHVLALHEIICSHRFSLSLFLMQEVLPGRNFTFWQWFEGVIDLTKKCLKAYWSDGYVKPQRTQIDQ